jgi:hypothetical protein
MTIFELLIPSPAIRRLQCARLSSFHWLLLSVVHWSSFTEIEPRMNPEVAISLMDWAERTTGCSLARMPGTADAATMGPAGHVDVVRLIPPDAIEQAVVITAKTASARRRPTPGMLPVEDVARELVADHRHPSWGL